MADWTWYGAAALAAVVAVMAFQSFSDGPAQPGDGLRVEEGPNAGASPPPMRPGDSRQVASVAILRNDGLQPRWATVELTGPDAAACTLALTLGALQVPQDFRPSPQSILIPVGGEAHVGIGFQGERPGPLACSYRVR